MVIVSGYFHDVEVLVRLGAFECFFQLCEVHVSESEEVLFVERTHEIV